MSGSELFTCSVNKDVQMYMSLYKDKPGCVLVFPPVDNYKRFLIHSSIENIGSLCSFSIGHGDSRRTVISGKENLLNPIVETKPVQSPVESNLILDTARVRSKKRPDRPVYVPKVRSKEIVETKATTPTITTMSKSSPKKDVKDKEAEDDWDTMFADDGECLNPDMMKELTAAVQNVQIVSAPTVTAVVQAEDEAIFDEFSHVVEVSHFPVEFKTQDLMMLFMAYKRSGFEIKWVDDTHALVIFSSAKIAREVVTNKNQFPGVRLQCLSNASAESKGRAKRCGATMQPYKARPETCAALARRLVTGALGVKSAVSKETLANERRILREAKEKKKLARKEQKDIWDDDEDEANTAKTTATTTTTSKTSTGDVS